VNVHKNAKLTPAGRALLVERVLTQRQRWAVVAVGFGVSKRTVGKWVRRWQAEGNVGLRDRSSRPHHCPRQVPGRVVRRIERLRRRRRTGPEIAAVVGLPVATVGLVLRRLGLSRLRALEPRGRPLRYQRASAGELVHIDSKRFVRFRQVGHRIHGERARRSRRVGFEHLHVCVDDATRLAYTELLAADDAASAVGFLGRAAAWFGRLGVQIERVMTDNAFAYTSHAYQAALRAMGARHLRTRPYTPRTNGKAERFIQTCLREWAYRRPYRSSAVRAAALPGFIQRYNVERPHTSLQRRPPLARLLELGEQRA